MTDFGDPNTTSSHTKDSSLWCNELVRARIAGPFLKKSKSTSDHLSTVCVHSGTYNDPQSGAVGTPIFQNSTFLLSAEQYKSIKEGYARDRFIYARYGNPNQWAVQEKLAALEGAESSLVFSSGMAAISATVLALLDKGGHVVTSLDLYGGTYNFFHQDLPQYGNPVSFVDPRNLGEIEKAIRPETQVLFFEIISNPLLKLADIKGLRKIADRHGLRLVIDATFATPINCRVLEYGVDIAVHSASKYLNGHSDLIAGAASGSRKLIDRVWQRLLNLGGCLDPHACFLLERGLKTLSLRMKTHNENSIRIAQFLQSHPQVKKVYHPFLESNPDRNNAIDMLNGPSGMVTFEIEGGDDMALKFVKNLRLFAEATSLGGVESLISLPFNTSHATMTKAQRKQMGIAPGCIRLSIGIEDVEDLLEDIASGLEATKP